MKTEAIIKSNRTRLLARLSNWPTEKLRRVYRDVVGELRGYVQTDQEGLIYAMHDLRRVKLLKREMILNAIIGRRLSIKDAPKTVSRVYAKSLARCRPLETSRLRRQAMRARFNQLRGKYNGSKKMLTIASEVQEEFREYGVCSIVSICTKSDKRKQRKSA